MLITVPLSQFIRLVSLRAVPPERMDEVFRLFPVVMLLVFGWQAWAILEMRIVRVRRASQVAWRTGILFLFEAAVVGLLATFDLLTAVSVTWFAAAQMLGGVGIQMFLLWRRGAKMPRTMMAVAGMTSVLALVGMVG